MSKWHLGGTVKPLLLFLIIFCCFSPFIYPAHAQAQGEDIKIIAEVIAAPDPYDIIATVKSVLEDQKSTFKVGDKIMIDAYGYPDERADIAWPLQKGDTIEVYGKGGASQGPEGTVGGIGVWVLPHYLRKTTDKFTLAVSVAPQGSGFVFVEPDSRLFDKGTPVALEAFSYNTDWEFDRWIGVDATDRNKATLTMNYDRNVIAYFKGEDDDGGNNTNWRKNLKPGDILLRRCHEQKSLLNCILYWTHSGLYVGDVMVNGELIRGRVVEARGQGVDFYRIQDWDSYPMKAVLHVAASDDIKEKAIAWASSVAANKPGFNKHLTDKDCNPDKGSWYCSELVWAAYYNQGVDLGWHGNWRDSLEDEKEYFDYSVPPGPLLQGYGHGIAYCPPVEGEGMKGQCLYYDDNIDKQTDYIEETKPCACVFGLLVMAYSPVDIAVEDPVGLNISKELHEIPDSFYVETDSNRESSPDDIILLPERSIGTYLITVTPEPTASPEDTYTLAVSSMEQTIILAENIRVTDIPDQPYKIKSTPSGIYRTDEDDDQTLPPTGWFSTNGPLLLVVLALAAVVIGAIVTRKPAPVPAGRGRVVKTSTTVAVGRRTITKPGAARWFGTSPWLVILGCCVVFIFLFIPMFPVTKTIQVTETTSTTVTKEIPQTVETEEVVKVYTGWMRDRYGKTQRVNYSDEIVDVQYVRAPSSRWDISLIDSEGKERLYRDISEYDLTKTGSITVPTTQIKNVTVTETVPQEVTKDETVQLRVNLIQLIFGSY